MSVEPKYPAITGAKSILDFALSLDYFVPDKKGTAVIPWFLKEGGRTSRLVLVLGENASGKSFMRRIVGALCHHNKIEHIALSMEARASSGMAIRGLIYGDESWQATGQNSAHTVTMGISTCRARETPHVLFWDEPDLGLSDSWAAGAGEAIGQFAENPPKHTKAIFVVTHSRPLVRGLLAAKPHYLHLGQKNPPKSVEEWLDRPIVARPIEKLGEEAHDRFLKIQKILNGIKKR